MREHLFRGKTEKGEWVEGDLICNTSEFKFIATGPIKRDTSSFDFYEIEEVIPETVGEWTGLTDDSPTPNKIFEGDIVASNSDIFKVIFRDGMFELTNQNEDSYVSFWQVEHIEVIGNIHDNPELLKGGECFISE